MFALGFPVGELLAVAFLAFGLDALLQGGGGFEFVAVFGSPLGGELAFKGVFEQGLTIDLKLFAGGLQAVDALVQFGKQFLDFGDDAVLFEKWGNRKIDCS